MATTSDLSDFFQTGGSLSNDKRSYIIRDTDKELERLILKGEYCSVLDASQTGKSSLNIHIAKRLSDKNVKVVMIDLQGFDLANISAEQWYWQIVSEIHKQLKLQFNVEAWWTVRSDGPISRFNSYLIEILLTQINEQVAIFIDEIGLTLNLDFRDDFFRNIRYLYNQRAVDQKLNQIIFILLGAVDPSDLIKNQSRGISYNIGSQIQLSDFKFEEVKEKFLAIFEKKYPTKGETVLRWILDWTGGHPYLTQKLSVEVAQYPSDNISEETIKNLVARHFERSSDRNLRHIPVKLSEDGPTLKRKLLLLYRQVLNKKSIQENKNSIIHNKLRLTGLTKTGPGGKLVVRNRIYASTFDMRWAKTETPTDWTQIIAIIASTIVILALISLPILFNYFQNQIRLAQAQTYIQQFDSSSNSEVRLTNLAGLLAMDDSEFKKEENDPFKKTPLTEQKALFDNLSNPSAFSVQLTHVIEAEYQDVDDTSLLKSMATALTSATPNEDSLLEDELNAWVQGREAAQADPETAYQKYSEALKFSQNRLKENPRILYDRALVNAQKASFISALDDFEKALAIDNSLENAIPFRIRTNEELYGQWARDPDKYPRISAVMVRPTPVPTYTPTITLTIIPTITFTPTITLTPSLTLTPTITDTPTITLTPSLTSRPTDTPKPECQLPQRLKVGKKAVVVTGQIKVKTEPGLNTNTVNVLRYNRRVDVIDNPECVDHIWWWKVFYDGQTIDDIEGWVGEGDKTGYWLEPVP